MNIYQAALLGIIEGVTEYLPISSTFHLIWAAKLLGLPQTEYLKTFEVVIQSGAIAAVAAIYVREVFKSPVIIRKLLISFFPTAMAGLLFYKTIKNIFFVNNLLQLFVFLLIGFVFIVFEGRKKQLSKPISEVKTKDALIIGIGQAVSIIPGVSRAGAVILTMMAMGYKRSEAAKYSFLLAIPTLISAGALDLYKSKDMIFSGDFNFWGLAAGTLFSFISATVVVKWFIKYLEKNTLTGFGYYRILVALSLFIIYFLFP